MTGAEVLEVCFSAFALGSGSGVLLGAIGRLIAAIFQS